jgi:predicted PurR-regulated permease PerM
MQLKSLNVYFFFLLLFGVGIIVFFIFQPFLTAVVAAAIISALFKGVYHTFEKWFKGSKGFSAFLTCLLVFVVLVTPVFFVLSLAVNEANTLYHAIGEQSALERMIGQGLSTIKSAPYADLFLNTQKLNQKEIIDNIKQFSQNALGLLQAAYQGISQFVFWVFIMFFTLFYFLIDGKRALRYIMRISPLRDEHDRLLIQKFVSISRATLKGTIVIGFIQGMLGGVMFWVAGVPSAAIWGLLMALLSLVPMVGSGLVWLPAGVIMLLLGNIWQGVFILAVGFGLVSTIDNILRPKLVGKDTQMHPLMVLFATLGGLSFFGLPGFVLGPIVVALFMALSDIYSIEFRDQLKEYNQ